VDYLYKKFESFQIPRAITCPRHLGWLYKYPL